MGIFRFSGGWWGLDRHDVYDLYVCAYGNTILASILHVVLRQ